MKKRHIIILFFFVSALCCIYAGHKIYRKSQKILSKYETLQNVSQALLAEQSRTFNVNKTLRVVCLGNSITKHGYLPDVEWYSDWGMAASQEENDYCHVLQRRLRQYNSESNVIPVNIAFFERNPTCDIDSLLGNVCENADVIVIRLGENVQDTKLFETNIQRLINKCQIYTSNVLITGNFWFNSDKEKILLNAAIDNKLRFIPLSWITEIRNAYPKIGDSIYNIHGKQYTITKDFIITHPNDKGMENIANAIFNAMTYLRFTNN